MMSILEAKRLNEAIERIERLEAEIVSLKSQRLAQEAFDEIVERQTRKPGRPKKLEAQAS